MPPSSVWKPDSDPGFFRLGSMLFSHLGSGFLALIFNGLERIKDSHLHIFLSLTKIAICFFSSFSSYFCRVLYLSSWIWPRKEDLQQEAGDTAWLPGQLVGRWGQRNWNSVQGGKKYFVLGRLEQPRQNKNLLYRRDKPHEPTKEGPLSFVLFESLFTSVSTVSSGHRSLVSLYRYLSFLDTSTSVVVFISDKKT